MVFRPWDSRVPDAIDALVALLKAVAPVTVSVRDGPFIEGDSSSSLLQIGWPGFAPGYQYPSRSMSEDAGAAAVSSTTTQQGLAPSELENFSVACVSLFRSGSTSQAEVSTARRAAYGNLKLVGQVLHGPDWLNGAVARATMGAQTTYSVIQDRRGLLAVVSFSIRCEAWAQQ